MKVFFQRHAKTAARGAAIWLFLLAAASVWADNSKISPDLQPLLANPSTPVNVIVQYNVQPVTGLLGGVLNLLGGTLKAVFHLIPAVSAILNPNDVLRLSNDANVKYISLDRPVRPHSTTPRARSTRRPPGARFGWHAEWASRSSIAEFMRIPI